MLNSQTDGRLLDLLLWLNRFLQAERTRYSNAVVYCDPSYRRGSHRLLQSFVPAYRGLNAFIRQKNASVTFRKAPEKLAQALVNRVLLADGVAVDHPVWGMPVSADLLRTLVFKGEDGAAPEWLRQAAFYDDFTVWVLRNLQGHTLGELRAHYLEEMHRQQHAEAERLKDILARVKAILSEKDFAILTSKMIGAPRV